MSGFNTSGVLSVAPARMLVPILLILMWYLGRLHSQYEPIVTSKVSSRLEEARKMIPSVKLDWPIPLAKDPRAAFNSSKLALLIEARPLPHLPPLILHMMAVIPPDWRFLFIGSNESIIGVSRAYSIKHQQVIGKLDLVELPPPWSIASKEDVFRLLTDSRFYDEFLTDVEWILKYEHDSILCANSETSVDDGLGWDWTGAARMGDGHFSGYGGLSLRRVSVIKRVLSFQARFNDSEPEDEWFGKRLWVLPGAKVASRFDDAIAVEDVYMERPMGYHIREGGGSLDKSVWGDAARRKEIFEYCPELSMIMDMKLERQRCPDDDGNGDREMADVQVTTAVLGEGDDAKALPNDAESAVLPPQPPPLPQPWKVSVTTFGSPLRTGID
ncbi:uncharacterized protein TRIVIDRAFT_228616 [Trichoderma virens Gv29-8]|uniref:DUF5672 domain-containing protein n=1 Tax=Hypocrea virens (strain Gv29-8 / FGSC 10586) TaxID=413071 RepID=G9ND21_HYPVG|nr:uncharacterized protein TRIVIDRAFT_228616 [Trichoderma virens Gv29-8]EHK15590.1 hypothetical protein TRIVIDRAFT_228616 [Trichoderma virens Gv29-8]UKZ51534.1 hypothetical protein TrVGV298_005294 [Trichoderma virens]